MAEMTRREGILAASRGQRADRVPFFHYWRTANRLGRTRMSQPGHGHELGTPLLHRDHAWRRSERAPRWWRAER
jgi:hypothetical protein